MIFVVIFFAGCTQPPDSDKAKVGEPKKTEVRKPKKVFKQKYYILNISQSSLRWIGTQKLKQHHGTLGFLDGRAKVVNDEITDGYIYLNMQSIMAEEMSGPSKEKLENDLKSDNFFDAQNYRQTTFTMTSCKSIEADTVAAAAAGMRIKNPTHVIEGNLEIKGVIRSISFPAKIEINDEAVIIRANFNIDRLKWGLNYMSGNSFGDKAISPEINIDADVNFARSM